MNDDTQFEFKVTKYASLIPVHEQLLQDSLITTGHALPPTVLTRRQKIARKTSQKVADIRLRLGSWIAGVDLTPEDW